MERKYIEEDNYSKKANYLVKEKNQYREQKQAKSTKINQVNSYFDDFNLDELENQIEKKKEYSKQQSKAINQRLRKIKQNIQYQLFSDLYKKLAQFFNTPIDKNLSLNQLFKKGVNQGINGFKLKKETTSKKLKNYISEDWNYEKLSNNYQYVLWIATKGKQSFYIDEPHLIDDLQLNNIKDLRETFLKYIKQLKQTKKQYEQNKKQKQSNH